jgi:hypothetical protein
MSVREVLSLRTLLAMIAGGAAVMLGAGFAHWDSVQQDVAGYAWLMTVVCYRALWLLFTLRPGSTND